MTLIKKLKLLTNEIRQSIPKAHRYIDNHYIVESSKKDHVVVLTRHPQQEDSFIISNKTILGRDGNQYVNRTIYKIDESNTKISPAPEAQDFEKKNLPALLKIREESSEYKCVDITKLIAKEE